MLLLIFVKKAKNSPYFKKTDKNWKYFQNHLIRSWVNAVL